MAVRPLLSQLFVSPWPQLSHGHGVGSLCRWRVRTQPCPDNPISGQEAQYPQARAHQTPQFIVRPKGPRLSCSWRRSPDRGGSRSVSWCRGGPTLYGHGVRGHNLQKHPSEVKRVNSYGPWGGLGSRGTVLPLGHPRRGSWVLRHVCACLHREAFQADLQEGDANSSRVLHELVVDLILRN